MFRRAGVAIVFLSALLTAGSRATAPIDSNSRKSPNSTLSDATVKEYRRIFYSIYAAGRYAEAHKAYLRMARDAESRGLTQEAIADWNNAGGASLASLQFHSALDELSRSREIAERSGNRDSAARASNNIASLHLQMGNFDAALRIADQAISLKPGPKPDVLAKLDAQRAIALSNLHRFAEAKPIFVSAIGALDDLGEDDAGRWDAAIRTRGMYGRQLIENGDLDDAEPVLTEALRLARIHRVPAANVLRSLALLRAAQHDDRGANVLFEAALAEPPGPTPQWVIYADRGEFRLDRGDPTGALEDFRRARALAAEMRADIVPADEDRVTLEAGLGRIAAGIVNANNGIAARSGERKRMRESFDVAEQDRQWSLRALVPAPDDWRTRLPAEYWDLLAQYQALERSLGANKSGGAAERAEALGLRLQLIEAKTGAGGEGRILRPDPPPVSALDAAQHTIAPDAVLFSFYVTRHKSWLWAITRDRFDLYPIPSGEWLQSSIDSFVSSVQSRAADTEMRGRELYAALFGAADRGYTRRARWLLELDGPLYNLPFAALVTSAPGQPVGWLVEQASIETIPGVLLMENRVFHAGGAFAGIADPVYNAADSRYDGKRAGVESALPRLPNTEREVRNCAAAWACPRTVVLTGMQAGSASVRHALAAQPSIIHFATHVVPGQGDHGSGVIALSLDRAGSLGLLGPRQILARPVSADLVVLDGCDSAQAAALPGTGLMGLTRAWIGAGAHAVLATLWDIPDDKQSALPGFYRFLREHPEAGPAAALRSAQLELLNSNKRRNPAAWAGYFLLART